MLAMTETAAEAVKTIVARIPDAADGGVRITDDGETGGYALSVAPAPEPTDTVVDSAGARVFLDPPSAAALDDLILDAQVAQDGSLSFALAAQS